MDKRISGLYKPVFRNTGEGKSKNMEIELRIDVDGTRPMNVISGDSYSSSGNRRYLGSFIFPEIRKTETTADEILLTGEMGKFSHDLNKFTNLKVAIRTDSDPIEAIVQWTDGSRYVSKCLCERESQYFRRVLLEHDYEKDVVPLEPYFFSTSSKRSHQISIYSAFAEAGIEIVLVREEKDSVPHPIGIPGESSVWTDDELSEAMANHFITLKDLPQWSLWLLSAGEYVVASVKGIMIGRKEKKRKGCAVFQNATGWQSPEEKRMRLFIYVHELGHCFNLHHPWGGSSPESLGESLGHATLSWMNCPWTYYSSGESCGEEAFWKTFKFQFSDLELTHLRHGFRDDVIFGGSPFAGKIESESSANAPA